MDLSTLVPGRTADAALAKVLGWVQCEAYPELWSIPSGAVAQLLRPWSTDPACALAALDEFVRARPGWEYQVAMMCETGTPYYMAIICTPRHATVHRQLADTLPMAITLCLLRCVEQTTETT